MNYEYHSEIFWEAIKYERIAKKTQFTIKELIDLYKQLERDLNFIAKKIIIRINIKKSRESDFKERDPVYLI